MQRKPIPSKKLLGSSLNKAKFKKIADSASKTTKKVDALTRETIQSSLTKPPNMPDNPATKYNTKTWKIHSLWAYDPITRTATKVDTNTHREVKDDDGKSVIKTYKSSDAITFILADREMPGAFKPAAAREHRFSEDNDKKRGNILYDLQGNAHTICPAHGELVTVKSLQTDHAHSSSDILKKQLALIKALNENLEFSTSFIKTFELHDLFVLIEKKVPKEKDKKDKKVDKIILDKEEKKMLLEYQGTLYFYERYYNDIDNLWNICQSCNLHKSDKNVLKWFQENKHFGIAFTDEMTSKGIDQRGLVTTVGGKGLAEFALEWYRENHKQYIITTKLLYKDVIFQIQNNLHKAAVATGAGKTVKAEGHNALASLSAALAASVTRTKLKITPPEVTPPTSPQASLSSSEDEMTNVQAAQIQAYADEVSIENSPDSKFLMSNMKASVFNRLRARQLKQDPNNLDLRIASYKANNRQAKKFKALYEHHLHQATIDATHIPEATLKQINDSAEAKQQAKMKSPKVQIFNASSSSLTREKDSSSSRKRISDYSETKPQSNRGGLMFGSRSQSSLELAETSNKRRRLDKIPSVTLSQKIDKSELPNSSDSKKEKLFKLKK
jgi:hypothetical protein